jgi:hypothetical protein
MSADDKEFARLAIEAMEAVNRTTMHIINPFGAWAYVLIGVTWALAIPFFVFVLTR